MKITKTTTCSTTTSTTTSTISTISTIPTIMESDHISLQRQTTTTFTLTLQVRYEDHNIGRSKNKYSNRNIGSVTFLSVREILVDRQPTKHPTNNKRTYGFIGNSKILIGQKINKYCFDERVNFHLAWMIICVEVFMHLESGACPMTMLLKSTECSLKIVFFLENV